MPRWKRLDTENLAWERLGGGSVPEPAVRSGPRMSIQYAEPYPDPLRQLGGHQRMGLRDVGEEIGVL